MGSVGEIVEHLRDSRSALHAARRATAKVRQVAEEFFSACLSLELSAPADRARLLLARLDQFEAGLGQATALGDQAVEQAEAMRGRSGETTDPATGPATGPACGPAGGPSADRARRMRSRSWVEVAGRRLPVRRDGSPTHGSAFGADGRTLRVDPIVSGTDRSIVADLDLNFREQRSASLTSHVEAKVAALMRRRRLPRETVLVLNNEPCKGPFSCRRYLASVLPEGARLEVWVTDGTNTVLFGVFRGTGSKIAS